MIFADWREYQPGWAPPKKPCNPLVVQAWPSCHRDLPGSSALNLMLGMAGFYFAGHWKQMLEPSGSLRYNCFMPDPHLDEWGSGSFVGRGFGGGHTRTAGLPELRARPPTLTRPLFVRL